MAFSLTSKSTLDESLASIAAAEVGELLGGAAENGSFAGPASLDERVHETRKVIKRLRALLRLYRGALDPARLVREDARLRELGRSLGGFRDETALRESLSRVVEEATGSARVSLGDGLPALVRALAGRTPPATEVEASVASVRGALSAFTDRAADFELERSGWPAIARGFRRTYARGRRAFERACRRPTEKRLHVLRRAAKRHQAHLSLLEPLWPGPIRAVRHELSDLGDLLGDDHDLSLLERRFEALAGRLEFHGLEAPFRATATARHAELRRRAFELGARVFAESPGHLAARFRGYFAAWR
jgi:CHAD domain-containing protein